MGLSREKDRRFWDRIAPKYARDPVRDQAAYEHKLALTQAHLRPGMRLLEIGCGTGSTALAHAPHVASIDAVDVSDAMLDIARGKAEAAGIGNVTFRQGDVDTLQAQAEGYDALLALSVLHLLPDRRGALSRMVAWLKPGGLLVTNTPCLGDSMAFIKPILPLGRWLGRFPHVEVFRQATLAGEIAAAGLVPVERWRPRPSSPDFAIHRKPA